MGKVWPLMPPEVRAEAGPHAARCTRRAIDIQVPSEPPASLEAFVFGHLAVNWQYVYQAWVITHLQSGLAMSQAACVFQDLDCACAAMIEIEPLRADWSGIGRLNRDERHVLRIQITNIALKHGGSEPKDVVPCGDSSQQFNRQTTGGAA